MCLLVVCSPDSTPRKKDLECASCNNPHGFGYAVIAGDKIITGRGMSAKKVIKEFLEVRKEYPKSYAMFHARYATHGVKNDDNCHPFKVGNDERTYLAHNGILDISIHTTDKRSDSRVFAEDTLPRLGGVTVLDDDNVWKMLNKWSSGSKIAVLTVDPDAEASCYILNENSGHWDNDGMWWSNDSYKENTWSKYVGMPASKVTIKDSEGYNPELDYSCPSCMAVAYEDANPYYCEYCTTCYECLGTYGDGCLCWTPEKDRLSAEKRGKDKVWYYDNYFDFKK
jgi:hypothetical protein